MTPQIHEDLRLKLPELAEGELDGHARDEVEAHLSGCPACQEELDALTETLGLLRGLPAVAAPPDLSARVRSRIRRRGGPRRRTAPVVQRLETTSAATVLIAAFVLAGARLLVPMPEVLDASGPMQATAEVNGGEVTVVRIPASEPGAIRRLLAAIAEAGGVDAEGRPAATPPAHAPIRPRVHDVWIPAGALPRLVPDAPRRPGAPARADGERIHLRVIVE